jgi:hypothetical protein
VLNERMIEDKYIVFVLHYWNLPSVFIVLPHGLGLYMKANAVKLT